MPEISAFSTIHRFPERVKCDVKITLVLLRRHAWVFRTVSNRLSIYLFTKKKKEKKNQTSKAASLAEKNHGLVQLKRRFRKPHLINVGHCVTGVENQWNAMRMKHDEPIIDEHWHVKWDMIMICAWRVLLTTFKVWWTNDSKERENVSSSLPHIYRK